MILRIYLLTKKTLVSLIRVRSLCIAMIGIASMCWVGIVMAQAYPAKPIRLVVPFPAGGVTDILARTLAQSLGRSLGQAVIVENKPGAGTIIGADLVARAPADGYTILLVGSAFPISAASRPKLPFDPLKDFTGVARLASTPMLIAVNPSLPARTLGEMVALARGSSPLSYATAGAGVPAHLAMEEFDKLAKIEVTHVPYQGGAPAALATIGGHTQLVVATLAELVQHVIAGKLRALAVTTAARTDLLKAVPTVAESGYPGFEASFWFGAWVPAGTPRQIVNLLETEMLRSLEAPEVKEALAKHGYSPAPMNSAGFDAFYRAEIARYAKVVKDANLKLD